MKKLLIIVAAITLLGSCKKEEKNSNKFDYDINILYGTWRITHLYDNKDGTYLNITGYIAEQYFQPTYAIFYNDGGYYGYGYFGSMKGTFKAIGKTIYTYDGTELIYMYDVLALTGNIVELEMYSEGSTVKIKMKAEKQVTTSHRNNH